MELTFKVLEKKHIVPEGEEHTVKPKSVSLVHNNM